jgi:hypothetical protein
VDCRHFPLTKYNNITNIKKPREKVVNKFTWNLISRKSVRTVGEPWFSSWRQSSQYTGFSGLTVEDLWNANTRSWDQIKLQEIFGPQVTIEILGQNIELLGQNLGSTTENDPNCLIWTESKNGIYTVKSGYRTLREASLRHLGPSFKLSPNILLLCSTSSTFLLHLPSANHFFKIVIVTIARASNWKFIFRQIQSRSVFTTLVSSTL